MSKKDRQRARARDLRRRLTALAGLAVIVGATVALLYAAGLLGNQGGGTTSSGVPIQDGVLLDPPPVPKRPGLQVGTDVGQLAPDFEVSRIEDGSRVRLSDFRGKPVLVNFWATWCLSCVFELPDLQALLDRHAGELTIIAIDRPEPVSRATDYLARIERHDGAKGISFTVNALDPADAVIAQYSPFYATRPDLMPISVFIDAQGVVTKLQIGPWRLPQMEQALAQAVQSAPLAENQ